MNKKNPVRGFYLFHVGGTLFISCAVYIKFNYFTYTSQMKIMVHGLFEILTIDHFIKERAQRKTERPVKNKHLVNWKMYRSWTKK